MNRREIRAKRDKQQTTGEAEILQEVPEMAARLAVALDPEIWKGPKIVIQDRGYGTESSQYQRGEAIMPCEHDAHGRDEFDQDSG
ncbi:MAG: hypothetical protein ACYDDA_06325, partial [Acidiferrobacteraceae bacterium]